MQNRVVALPVYCLLVHLTGKLKSASFSFHKKCVSYLFIEKYSLKSKSKIFEESAGDAGRLAIWIERLHLLYKLVLWNQARGRIQF